ncbi:DUF371 domain-containing protein [Candidatus Bathyarchaeota archaeon]|nr:DUF371 domain-containing protein [Candidatus Bathyarchaeota archaeon]
MKLTETFLARGHRNILALHETTVMTTREAHLSRRGDCVAAVSAEKGLSDLSHEIKEAARRPGAIIILTLRVGGEAFEVKGIGHPSLTYADQNDMVTRKSGYICDRTLMVHSDRAACDMPRTIVDKLWDPNASVEITVTVEVPDGST